MPNILHLETIFFPQKKVNSLKITRVFLTAASILIPHSNHKSPKTIGINTRTPKNIYYFFKKPNNTQQTNKNYSATKKDITKRKKERK